MPKTNMTHTPANRMYADCTHSQCHKSECEILNCTSDALWDNFLAKMTDDQLRTYHAECAKDAEIYASQESFVFSRMVIAKRILTKKEA